MFSLLPPQKGMLVGVKNTALRNVLFLVYACIQKPDNTEEDGISNQFNTHFYSLFPQAKHPQCAPAGAGCASQLGSTAGVCQLWQKTQGAHLCYSQVPPATFCKRTQPFLHSSSDRAPALGGHPEIQHGICTSPC